MATLEHGCAPVSPLLHENPRAPLRCDAQRQIGWREGARGSACMACKPAAAITATTDE